MFSVEASEKDEQTARSTTWNQQSVSMMIIPLADRFMHENG